VPDPTDRLVFGTASLGLDYGLARPGAEGARNSMPARADALALVRAAHARGLRVFDTAPAYGESEERLGAALEGLTAEVWTKVGRVERVDESLSGTLERSLDESLGKLRRARVELLQWHNWTAQLGQSAHFRAAWERLARDPRVGALGATTYGVEDAQAAVESGLFQWVQVEWNLLRPMVIDRVGPLARARGVQMSVRSVYLQGALTDEGRKLPALPTLEAAVQRARGLASAHGIGLTRLALRAALEHRYIARVLVGIDRVEQVDEALAVAAGAALPEALRASLAGLDLGGDPSADPRTWKLS
jgi:aryl-alcohol dehydrogenase-like predicted oxidoreductase